MKPDSSIHIAVVDSSAIVRSGVTHVIKHIPENDIYPVEISSMNGLTNYLSLHTPDIVIVNPVFDGWFDITKYKEEYPKTKFVALLYSVLDANLLKPYDCEVSITEDMDSIIAKLTNLTDDGKVEAQTGQDILSQREKEIVVCVVKDQQGNRRPPVHLNPHRRHTQAQHSTQTPDTFTGRTDHLCHSKQAGRCPRGESPVKSPAGGRDTA